MLKLPQLTDSPRFQRWAPALGSLAVDVIVAIGFLWLVIHIFLNSWASEDAYITYRVIDNFDKGYGLRWNIHERVQVYTHPLWTLLHLPVQAVWKNIFHVSMALSVLCSAAAIMLVLCTVKKPVWITVACFFLPFYWSKAVMDYTSSGLENPLTYALFALFGYTLIKLWDSKFFWFWISFSVALALTNRLDTGIIYIPTLVWLVIQRWREVRWGQIFTGALPIIGWLCFSLIYYGFIFPNTKYAKLNTGMDFWLYFYQAVHYTKYFLTIDTMSAIILMLAPAGCITYAFIKRETPANRVMPWLPACIALGIYYYCFYIMYIGGDYMAGRFWALPVFATIWLVYVFIPANTRHDIVFTIACALFIGHLIPKYLEDIRQNCQTCVVAKQRLLDAAWTFRHNRLIKQEYPLKFRKEGEYMFANDGRKLAEEERNTAKPMYFIGMGAFYAGPTVPLIDELGLADPLLARLPATSRQNFYIAHFKRIIPNGYNHAINTGSTERMDPSLAKYYEKLRLITSGPIFDTERLKTIILFNLGTYDHWKEDYLSRNKP